MHLYKHVIQLEEKFSLLSPSRIIQTGLVALQSLDWEQKLFVSTGLSLRRAHGSSPEVWEAKDNLELI